MLFNFFLQGYGSDMEDEPRRQRHTSTSSNTGGSTPQRIRPPTVQRIRTESSCSNFSDYSKDPRYFECVIRFSSL